MASNSAKTRTKIMASQPWWKTGVIYQLYIRSFKDTNGDGVGDLPGVIKKLDYLKDLGVDAIWLSPFTVSSNADWGYDVTDYYNIDPELGTMKDFEKLMSEAAKRGLKVLMDFVPNHTSIHHHWFKDAKKSKSSKYRNFYIWADPKKDGRPPNNWKAYGGGSAWSYHSATGQYYLHNFFREQADLNWRNPEVIEEFDNVMTFWLKKGISGFRIDVFNMLIKDAKLRDNPKSTVDDGIEVRLLGQKPVHTVSQPEIHEILKRWRKLADSHNNALLLGESTLVFDVRQLASFYGAHDELELAFNLKFLHAPFTAPALREVVESTEASIASPDWPVWTGSNHDEKRFPSNWAGGDERKIRCGMLMILALRGTPVLYYGDEIGMERVFISPWRMKDPRGKRNWPIDGGRDRYRTPMQWKDLVGAGFTKPGVRPWLPYGDAKKRNVEKQLRENDSTLKFTKDLIELRRREPDLQLGNYKTYPSMTNLWTWRRGKEIFIAINMSNHHHEIKQIRGTIEICTNRSRDGETVNNLLHLAPWEGVVIKLKKR